jgi:hypothetical protein
LVLRRFKGKRRLSNQVVLWTAFWHRLGEKGQESKTYTNDTSMMIFWAAAAQLATFLLGHESGGIRVVIDHRRLTTGILASHGGHLLVIETHQRGRHLRVSKSGQGGSKTDSIVITSLMARAPANLRVEVRREK